ncbi:MAG: hypothetical protein WD049_08975 [Candidatus Paceibacterota bacterium]
MDERTKKQLFDATAGLLPVVSYDGAQYSFTGKTGERVDTGVAVREYERTSGSLPQRIWVDVKGNVYSE